MRALFAIALLVLVLPFEPMEPLVAVLGFKMSHLEVVAFVLLALSASGLHARRLGFPLAVPALALLLAVFVSAAFAEGSLLLPLKFSLRMTAGLVAFVLTSFALAAAPRFDLLCFAFAAAGTTTAAIALLEAGAVPAIEGFVAPFREHSFEVGGQYRVAATFSYPNTAAGFLALTLPPAMSFVVRRNLPGRMRAVAFIVSLGIFSAILLTYSRGALLGAIAASVVFTLMIRSSNLKGLKDVNGLKGLLGLNASFLVIAAGLFLLEPSFQWRAWSEDDRSWYLAEIVPKSEALELASGALTDTRVQVANVGKLTWGSSGEKPFYLSYRWFSFTTDGTLVPLPIEGERTRLPSPLAPGQRRGLIAAVRAPEKPGSYVMIWDMVHKNTTWFSDKVGFGTPVNVVVDGTVSAGAVRPGELQQAMTGRAWRPGRRELWGIALGLFLEHPVLGVGPDNFRWVYGAFAGKEVWDTRVFSNSLYLELLSTIGIVGFAAFVLLAGRALIGLMRRASKGSATLEVAAIAASLTGFLVHGLFDYLLAFTPIYLAFFVLLGAASAALREEALA